MKIKKVIIDGFRAYESAVGGTFDFSTSPGKCADFVALFAPNGFGKTSFYDAVEYALTGNISRFVREAHRADYDNKSKTQINQERKQYILRNHEIAPSSIAKIDVFLEINDKEEIKSKTIPKPKAGARDFLFKKDDVDLDYAGMKEVFLSQEAIDAFLREEKPEARYARFMSNFGDADEIFRANLATLKRELDNTLAETKATAEELRIIANRAVNPEIFNYVNHTIHALSADHESVEQVGEQFTAELDRMLRNHITKRVHDLSTLRGRLHGALTALEQVAAHRSAYAMAREKQLASRTLISNIESTRVKFAARNGTVQIIAGLNNSIAESNRRNQQLSEIADKIPAFEELHEAQRVASVAKLDYSDNLAAVRVELTSLAEREAECARRADVAEAELQRLLALQKDYPSTYLQIETKEDQLKARQLEQIQQRELFETISARLSLRRQQFDTVRAIEIGIDHADAPELSMLASDDFSPIELRGAIVELGAKQSLFEDANRALEAAQLQRNQIAELVAIGRELLAKSDSSCCPLCSHDHASHQALIDAVLGNAGLSDREQTALAEKHKAEAALTAARSLIERLLQNWNTAQLKYVDILRESIRTDEEDLTQKKEALRRIEGEVAQLDLDVAKLKAEVLNLPSAQFMDKLSTDMETQRVRRETEVKDRAECKQQLAIREAREKDLIEKIAAEQTKVDVIDNDPRFRAVRDFCQLHQIATNALRMFVEERIEEVRRRIADFEESRRSTLASLADIDKSSPQLASWNPDEAATADTSARDALLAADTVIVPFETICEQHIPGFDATWSLEDVESQLASSLSSSRAKLELHERILQNYNLLINQLADVRPYIESIEAQRKLDEVTVKLNKEETLSALLSSEYRKTSEHLDKKIKNFFHPDLINSIYRRIDPHPDFKRVEFKCEFQDDKPTLEVFVADEEGDLISPNLYFSAAQINILSLSIFLARALHAKNGNEDVKCIFVDDPIHSMDSINILSTIDLLRSISLRFDRQIILSTHDRNFFDLLQRKLPPGQYNSKFLELETFGKVVAV